MTQFGTSNAGTCTTDIVTWEIGGDLPSNVPNFFTRDPTQCPAGQACSVLGAIYQFHARGGRASKRWATR